MLDISIFGIDPGWAHIHNALLHGLNSLLVFALILKISGSYWKSYILSIIFLVHPLHVESVAWIAERKDVLCAFFFLLGLLFYDRFSKMPSKLNYMVVLISYVLALLAKPMAVTFPIVLLILDFFIYRERFTCKRKPDSNETFDHTSALVEKLPFLALSIASSIVTIIAQDDAVQHIEQHPIQSRLITAVSAYMTYLRQFLFPVDLNIYYPLATNNSLADLFLPGIGLLALCLLALTSIRKLPLAAAGFSIYISTLIPVIGLVQVGSQAHADRYMYLPSIGLLIACIYLIPEKRNRYFRLGRVISILLVIYLTTICYWQVSYWKDRHSLFSRALDINDQNYMAHLQLAGYYWMRNMLDDSRQHVLSAMEIRPELPEAYMHMGNIALAEREFSAAEKFYQIAIPGGKNLADLQNNLGIALAEQGRIDEARKVFEKVLQLEPEYAKARANLMLYTNHGAKEPPQ